jgi:hypothetical protein
MKNDKKPSVTLKHTGGLVRHDIYRVEKLNGVAYIELNHSNKHLGKVWRVGDSLSVEVADQLCEEGRYDVTVLAP